MRDVLHSTAVRCRSAGNLTAMLSPRTTPPWQIWECPPAPGIVNMATDAALLSGAGRRASVWRWYGWSRPTVSFGRNEQAAGRFTPASLANAGFDAVRRPTGGRALLHDQELTYAVVMPVPRAVGWREPYGAISRLLHDALRDAEVPVDLAPARPGQRPDGPVCFDAPDAGELLLHGRKLVGSAVWRQDDVYLQHGSILLVDRQADLQHAAATVLPPVPPAAALSSIATPEQLPILLERFKAAVARRLAAWDGRETRPSAFVPDRALQEQVAVTAADLARDAWLWRR